MDIKQVYLNEAISYLENDKKRAIEYHNSRQSEYTPHLIFFGATVFLVEEQILNKKLIDKKELYSLTKRELNAIYKQAFEIVHGKGFFEKMKEANKK